MFFYHLCLQNHEVLRSTGTADGLSTHISFTLVSKLFKLVGAVLNLSISNLSTSDFKLEPWTKNCRQIHEIMSNRFLNETFYSWFLLGNCQNLLFGRPPEYIPVNSKHFNDFLEIFLCPKILSLKSFGNSWGNL